jgi:hypothetical protein
MDKKKRNKSKEPPERSGYRSIPLSPELAKGIQEQFQRFTEKFGRPPGPDDPVFFGPSADEPRPTIDEVVDQHMLEAMHNAGVYPAPILRLSKDPPDCDAREQKAPNGSRSQRMERGLR